MVVWLTLDPLSVASVISLWVTVLVQSLVDGPDRFPHGVDLTPELRVSAVGLVVWLPLFRQRHREMQHLPCRHRP